MKSAEKLKRYLLENGIKFAVFADKIGLTRVRLYSIMEKKDKFQPEYWEKIIYYTQNQIKFEDLLFDFLNSESKFNVYGPPDNSHTVIVTLDAFVPKKEKSLSKIEKSEIVD